MTLSSDLAFLMDNARNRLGGTNKLGINDLTSLINSPYSVDTIFDYGPDDIIKNGSTEYSSQIIKPTNDFVNFSVNGPLNYTNVATTYDNKSLPGERIKFLPNISITNNMVLVMVAKFPSNATYSGGTILHPGAYDSATTVTINSNDWKTYFIPLMQSPNTSRTLSIYLDESQAGTVDIKHLTLYKISFEHGTNRNVLSGLDLESDYFVNNKIALLDNGTLYYIVNKGPHAMFLLDPSYGGHKFTISFWARSDNPASAQLHFECWGGGGLVDVDTSSEWKHYTTSGTLNNNDTDIYFWSNNANPVQIAGLFMTIDD